MKTRFFLSLLGFACLLSVVKSQCDLKNGTQKVAFPDFTKSVADSYIWGVEYSVPGANETIYYTEHYEIEFQRGRLDGHQAGENFQYLYRAQTWETWTLKGDTCDLKNITVVPEFLKDDQTDWFHNQGTEQYTTIGPSAMFKIAYDDWQKQSKAKKSTMAYMGELKVPLRGEKAVYWRRCMDDGSIAEYFFAADEQENAFDTVTLRKNITPLRVAFYLQGKDKAMSQQFYDIISSQPRIPPGVQPFYLPKGKNCQRDPSVDAPPLPNFSENSILLSAEVLYEKISTKDNENELKSSYYSTLMFVIDRQINHLAYSYSSWNTSKPDEDHQEPFLDFPERIVYDMTHRIEYKINYGTGKCEISRNMGVDPKYKLPENGGAISLTDPYVLFPNNEMTYLSRGKNRGLIVNVFEAEIKNYVLDSETMIDRAIVSHSYLMSNEELENNVAVRNAPVQMQLNLFRKKDIKEVLTFNIYRFTTKLPNKRYLFDIQRCFKNSDDYTFLTLGLEAEERYVPQLQKKLPDIESNVVTAITLKSELNAVRIPNVMTEIDKNIIYVTMLILDRPPMVVDFPTPEVNMTIEVASEEEDTQGVSNFGVCGNNCLEQRSDCWGFALCGATCYYGSSENTKVTEKAGCNVYRRYTNSTFIQSKEQQVHSIVSQVEVEEFMIMVVLDSGERVELKATSAHVTDPSEDDSLFEKMGNMLDPRMRVLKAGAKLKKGSAVKKLGKLRYDECQKLCLDFKDCDTLSFCLINADCSLSNKYGSDLGKDDLQEDDLCITLTRKYADHFDRSPGVFVTSKGGTKIDASTVEDCARECLKQTKFKCLSFDHCAGEKKTGCTLYDVHYLNSKDRQPVEGKNPSCGHYTRKLSIDFKKKPQTRIVGGSFPVLTNLTLEECAKRCVDYGEGTCYGYDFCQDDTLYATSCTIFDSDPSRQKSSFSDICTNYVRTDPIFSPRPFSNSYAGGIGFLCFLVGSLLGVAVVFVIAYIRVNKR